MATVIIVCLGFWSQDDSRPPLYEETTGERMDREGDSSEDEEENGPPPEPPRFGWVQGVMVGALIRGVALVTYTACDSQRHCVALITDIESSHRSAAC